MDDTYKRCSRCVMDNATDDKITFDEHGVCNYCTDALSNMNTIYFPNEEGKQRLDEIIRLLKKEGENKKYDCMMGISGGLDSSYLAYLGHKWGLRILAVHIDDGYDTNVSKNNISKLIAATGIDLITIRPDKDQYNDLVKAYMKAGVPNITVPQDSILFAALFKYARENKIKYFLSGGNFSIEYISQIALRNMVYPPEDTRNIRDIHKKYGNLPINKLSFISPYVVAFDKYVLGFKTFHPLDYIDYKRDQAFKELADFCGFEDYGGKHAENMLTAYMMQVWLPKKFNADVRTLYLSSMIVSGQITRDSAMNTLSKPIVDNDELMDTYISEILNNLKLTQKEYSELMERPGKLHTEYKTHKLYPLLFKLYMKIVGERPHI